MVATPQVVHFSMFGFILIAIGLYLVFIILNAILPQGVKDFIADFIRQSLK